MAEKGRPAETSSAPSLEIWDETNDNASVFVGEKHESVEANDDLQRGFENRQLQLVAIGASVGTALFVSIGGTLHRAGPGGLLLAFCIHNIFLAMVNNSMAEMSTYQPVAGGFIRMAGHWVDDAFGFATGWNFFFYQALVIPFEIVALSLVLSFWSDHIPAPAIIVGCISLYIALNIFAVRIYGESEFWLSGGKVFLITMLFFFTFVTMVGGNPAHDAFGFRNFNSPGAFAEHLSTGTLGQFEGFLDALWAAAFTCVGPEYVSIVAAEAKHPRTHIKTAFKNVYWRQVLFFGGGALAVGVLVPYNDPTLVSFFGVNSSKNSGAAGASPYIIAMGNLGIDVLPHIATALLATTIFSAGNTYSYCATRTLHSLALEGRAPKFLRKCSKRGIPYICFGIVMLFPLLAFMQMSNSAAQVLNWLITLATAATIIDYVVISITYLRFYYACKKQGFDRSQLPYTGWMQPYCGWLGLVWMSLIVLFFGYASFKPWNSVTFFTTYTLVILYPFLYLGWKFFKGTKVIPLAELDLVWRAPAVTAYEESAPDRPIGFWREVTLLFFSKVKKIKNVKKKSFV